MGCYSQAMSAYLTYKLWKLAALGVVAFIWGFYCEHKGLKLNGQPQRPEQSGAEPAEKQDH